MATKNPFGLLAVRRDADEEEQTTRTVAVSATTAPLFGNNQTGEQKKKKKVRPEEKKKSEENAHEDADEGFEVVKKKAHTGKPRVQNDENVPEEKTKEKHLKNKGAFAERNNKVTPGKRQFERHSGTGRGKEISKNGAGGKHTWGTNPKNIARNGDDEYDSNGNCKLFFYF